MDVSRPAVSQHLKVLQDVRLIVARTEGTRRLHAIDTRGLEALHTWLDGFWGEALRDTGIGIAPEVLPRVFDLFVQERQAIDRSQGGLGLGLTIVRNLVERHGGTVSANSDGPGKGSEFVPDLNGIKLIALTGYGQESDRQRSREAGFDHHLVKPVDLGMLESDVAESTQHSEDSGAA